jgi:hypothetical protein
MAMREALQWTAANLDKASAILGRQAHSHDAHSHQALREMLERDVSPLDLTFNRTAIETAFENMHRFGLVERTVPLSYAACAAATVPALISAASAAALMLRPSASAPPGHRHPFQASSSRRRLASFKSAVAKPSVNRS